MRRSSARRGAVGSKPDPVCQPGDVHRTASACPPPSMVPASLDGLELICCLGATPSKAPREGSLRRGFVKAVFPQPLKMHEEAQSAGLGATAPIHLIKPRSSPCHPHPALPGVGRPKCSPLPAQ